MLDDWLGSENRGGRSRRGSTKLEVDALGDSPGDGVLDERVSNNDLKGVVSTLGVELRTSHVLHVDDSGVHLALTWGGHEDSLVSSLGVNKAKESLLGNQGTGGGTSSVSRKS